MQTFSTVLMTEYIPLPDAQKTFSSLLMLEYVPLPDAQRTHSILLMVEYVPVILNPLNISPSWQFGL